MGYHGTTHARFRQGPAKRYRGSRSRLKRVRVRGNFSWELWLLAGWVAFLLFVLLPWMMQRTLIQPH